MTRDFVIGTHGMRFYDWHACHAIFSDWHAWRTKFCNWHAWHSWYAIFSDWPAWHAILMIGTHSTYGTQNFVIGTHGTRF